MVHTTHAAAKSTIVRLFQAPWPVRLAFRTLERLAPSLGARWAEGIWMTLPRSADRQRAGHPGGERFVTPYAGTGLGQRLPSWSGGEIVGEVWGQAGPTIYVVHGWAGHRGQFAGFVAPLLARGYRVVAFDMPSHGDSAPGVFGPRSTSFPEFADALCAVVARFGPPYAVVAHSAGAIATATAIVDGMRPDRLVLLVPMVGGISPLREFGAVMGFGERTLSRMTERLERRVGAPLRHFEVPELGRAVRMPPTLVLHDRDDRSTPVSDGAAIAAAWPGARLRVTTGLGHNKILRSPAVIAEVVDFLT